MARTGKYLILLFIVVPFLASGQKSVREAYIQKYKDLAIRQMNTYHIPASIILAQACLESGNGTSRLAVKGNNHFGIKCHNWNGKTIYHNDDKKGECFRRYITAEDSFRDHSEFLRNGPRYQSLFDLGQTDYKAWAHGLKAAGYATDKRYAQLLIDIIEDYELYRYDTPAVSEKEMRKARREEKRLERKERRNAGKSEIPATGATASASEIAVAMPSDAKVYSHALKRYVYLNNGVQYVVATGEESYRQLAKEYNLFTKELLRFNDLSSSKDKIAAGTIVYIEKKKNRNKAGVYTVSEGDTPYSVSQKTGIRLKSLCKMNGLAKGSELYPGTTLKLKK
ncbi:MAG: glucosaminidase domain-containing protein [Bacteroidetes bacterium]|uniref:Peptidoglycan hydrolase n=1 Tax=Candidatus Egerieousia excrementavium TaxID=2840778 RepID=A0A9D9GXS0_9BACT|nr:glucosaminidase domain-containing protein [Candidatus Egerieousia excrementavium]